MKSRVNLVGMTAFLLSLTVLLYGFGGLSGSSAKNYGRFAYAANSGSNNISAYSIGSNGALTAIADSPFAAGSSPISVTTVGSVQ